MWHHIANFVTMLFSLNHYEAYYVGCEQLRDTSRACMEMCTRNRAPNMRGLLGKNKFWKVVNFLKNIGALNVKCNALENSIIFHNILFIIIIIIMFWLGCGRPSGLFIFDRACFASFYTHASLLPSLFVLYLISFLLFPCASVWENTLAWVPHFL